MKLSHINLRDLQDTEYQLIKNKLSAWPVFTTDIIIHHEERGKKGIVIIERGNEPYGLALPGGFVELGLTTEQNAIKEAKEETNLNIKILNSNHPYVFSDPKRDPRGNIIGLIYIANSKGGRIKAGDDAKHTHLMNREELQKAIKSKKFAVDHGKILTYLLKKEVLL